MKKIFTLVCVLLLLKHNPLFGIDRIPTNLNSQSILNRFETYLPRTSNVGISPIRSDASINISEDFKVNLQLKFSPKKNKDWSIDLSDKLGSTNKYTPILDKGKWAIDNSFGVTGSYTFKTTKRFFHSTVAAFKAANSLASDDAAMKQMPDASMSGMSSYWVSLNANWDYQEFLVLKDSLFSTMDEFFNSIHKHAFSITFQLNGLNVFSFAHGIQLSYALGYLVDVNKSNYDKLDEVNISQSKSIKDSLGNTITISKPQTKGKTGVLKFSTGHTISADIHFTIQNKESGNLGVDIFTQPKLTFVAQTHILNIRTGLNFAILGKDDKKTKTYIGVVADVKNVTKRIESKQDARQRIIPSLVLGVPIPTIGRQ